MAKEFSREEMAEFEAYTAHTRQKTSEQSDDLDGLDLFVLNLVVASGIGVFASIGGFAFGLVDDSGWRPLRLFGLGVIGFALLSGVIRLVVYLYGRLANR